MGRFQDKLAIAKLSKELSDLKLLINDQLASQIQVNCEMRTEMEMLKSRYSRLSILSRVVKLLFNKYKEQKGAMNILVKLLRGKWEDCVCKCGRKMNILTVNKMRANETQENNKVRNSETASAQSSAVVQIKAKSTSTDNNNCKRITSSMQDESTTCCPKFYRHENGEIKIVRARPNYSYTQVEIQRIGKPVADWEVYGPLESLNSAGQWYFKLADHFGDRWEDIVANKENIWMCSRPVLLSDEFSGLTILIVLKSDAAAATTTKSQWTGRGLFGQKFTNRNDDNTKLNQNFRISLHAPDIAANTSIHLPLLLNVRVKIESVSQSHSHKFRIDKLGWHADDKLVISHTDITVRNRLPEMDLYL